MTLTVEDKKNQINEAINKILIYINSNLNIKEDLTEYYKTLGLHNIDSPQKATATINYIFERRFGVEKNAILSLVLRDVTDLTQREREIITSLQNSVNGVFELKKITPDEFTMYNLINEKTYFAKPLEKFSKFSNLYTGNYLVCRIVKLDNEYYVYHIVDNISLTNKVDAYRLAVLKIAQNPEAIYYDNEDKLIEIKNNIQTTLEKFQNIFNAEYVVTTNKLADNLIEKLNAYFEGNNNITKESFNDLIKEPEKYVYYDILNLYSNNDIFKNAQAGFSHHKETYDVAILLDKDTGLNVLPAFGTFLKIFEADNYQEIEGYKECVKAFVENKKIPKKVLQIAYEKYSQNFINRINEIFDEHFENFDEILNKYKNNIEGEEFSPTTTLYNSNAFRKLLEGLKFEEFKEETSKYQKVGRNEPCPCGSGKKFKKCCGKAYNL